jgi:HlyD family secretion protein
VISSAQGVREHATVAPRALVRHLRTFLGWGVALAVVVALVLGVTRYRSAHATAPVRFETAKVDRGAIAAKVTATGTLSALVTVVVGSQVSGRIDKLFADFESQVKKGQTVATIEPSLFRASVAQARANYLSARAAVEKARSQQLQAQRAYARAKALYNEGIASRADYEAAEADIGVADSQLTAANAGVAQAQAALAQTELNLHYTTIVSPIDGVVISRNVDVGQTVAAALQAPTLFTIAQDLTRMQVDTNVAEADVGKVRAQMEVTFTVDAYPQRTFNGIVRQVRDNAQTIQNVVTYDAVIDVDNGDRVLKPGMTASVTFTYATRDAALRVPNAALRFKPDAATTALMNSAAPKNAGVPTLAPDERAVWVLRQGRAVLVAARVGISDGSTTEVLGGDVHDGDSVVVEALTDATKK